MSNTSKLVVFFIGLVIILLLLPIKYPTSISSKGKLLSYKSWTLSRITDGRLVTSLVDNSTGINNSFSMTQFERGDAVQFKFNIDLFEENKVKKGDTIGFVISNEIEKDIERLRGELATARAMLNVQLSSEKESIIEAEKNRLNFARTELQERTKIYNRQKQLFERDLISQQEFEADEARYELAKININIAEERLRTVESGAKEEEIDLTSSQINAIEKEIEVLSKRFESNNIIAPISGMISRVYSQDTLFVINDTSKIVILIPVVPSDLERVFIGQNVEIYASDVNETLNAEITSIDNSVITINANQYVIVTALSEDRIKMIRPGLTVECEIETPDKTMLSIFVEKFGEVFNISL